MSVDFSVDDEMVVVNNMKSLAYYNLSNLKQITGTDVYGDLKNYDQKVKVDAVIQDSGTFVEPNQLFKIIN